MPQDTTRRNPGAGGMLSYWARSFKQGERLNTRNYLTKIFDRKSDAYRKADQAITNVIGPARQATGIGKMSLAAWGMGIGLGVPHRLRQGDSLPAAIGKEAVRDAAYIAMPYLLPLTAAKGMAKMYPEMNYMSEMEREQQVNRRTLGGGYQETEADFASRARAMEMIERTKMSQPGGTARRMHRTP